MGAFADTSDPITQLPNDVAWRLAGDAFFEDITIFAEDDGVTDDDVDAARGAKALGGRAVKNMKQGVAVIVFNATDTVPDVSQHGPVLDIEIQVRVLEIPKLNRTTGGTGKRSGIIKQEIYRLLHLWQRCGVCLTGRRSSPYNDGKGVVGVDMFFGTEIALAEPERVGWLTIAATGQSVTLSCATALATIYYTTDGGYPKSGHGTTTAYTAPFTVTPGTFVRAVAYRSGMTASDLVQEQIGTPLSQMIDDSGNLFTDDQGNPIVANS